MAAQMETKWHIKILNNMFSLSHGTVNIVGQGRKGYMLCDPSLLRVSQAQDITSLFIL